MHTKLSCLRENILQIIAFACYSHSYRPSRACTHGTPSRKIFFFNGHVTQMRSVNSSTWLTKFPKLSEQTLLCLSNSDTRHPGPSPAAVRPVSQRGTSCGASSEDGHRVVSTLKLGDSDCRKFDGALPPRSCCFAFLVLKNGVISGDSSVE